MTTSKPGPKMLSQKDLLEFRLRTNALEVARNNFAMVQESYQNWVKETMRAYRIKGKATIDISNGSIVPIVQEVKDAGLNDQAQTS